MHKPQCRFATPSLLLLAGIFALLNVANCSTDARQLEQLNTLRKSSSKGLIQISIDMFESFVEHAPRTFGIIVMFSAPPSLCKPCSAMSTQLSHVVSDYYTLPSDRAARTPLFFAELKLSQSDKVFFVKYHLQHVPILYYFPPGRTKSYPRPLEEDSPNNFPLQHVGIGANAIKDFVNKRVGSRLKVIRGNYQIPFVQTVRAYIPLILLIVAIAAAIAVYTGAYKSPMLWFGLVVLVYIFSVGGGHYSWIHNVPLAVVNKEGKTEYVAGGSRSQYVAEGFFVSATCVSISVLVIIIQELPSVMPNKAGQTLVGMALFVMTIFAIAALLVMYHIVRILASQASLSIRLLVSVFLLTFCIIAMILIPPASRKCPSTCSILSFHDA